MPTNPNGTVTLEGVELVRSGSWRASTGPVTITPEDLDDVVRAAADPEVDAAALRIGHVDPRFDGEPSLGWVRNPRVRRDADGGATLVADLADIPAGLADILPTAFRRRSVELAWGVKTPAGATYRMALTGLALLGVQPPAVKGLADVLALYGKRVAASATADTAHASSVATVELAFTISDPAGAAEAAVRTIAAASAATIPTPPTDAGHTGADDAHPQGGPQVNEQRLRELMGLEADKDLEAAVTELVAKANASTTPPPAGDASGTTPPPAGTTPPGTAPPAGTPPVAPVATAPAAGTPAAPVPVAAAGTLPPGVVAITEGVLADLVAKANAGATAAATLLAQERDTVLATALSEGRIAPADVDKWKPRLEADLAGTKTLLAGLTPAFPTTELGASGAGAGFTEPDEAAWAAFENDLGIGGPPAPAATATGKDA